MRSRVLVAAGLVSLLVGGIWVCGSGLLPAPDPANPGSIERPTGRDTDGHTPSVQLRGPTEAGQPPGTGTVRDAAHPETPHAGLEPRTPEEAAEATRPRFGIPGVSTGDPESAARWVRKNLLYHPSVVVEIPGRYPADEPLCVLAELVGDDGDVQTRLECDFVRLSSNSLVLLLPTARPSEAPKTRLRLLLLCGNAECDRAEMRLLNQGGVFGPTQMRQQVRSLLGPGPTSAVVRAASEDGVHHAARQHIHAVADLLRRQFAVDDALNAIDRGARRQALVELELLVEEALERAE